MKNNGFNRLRGVAAAGALGVGMLAGGAGTVRASSQATPFDFILNTQTKWSGIGNQSDGTVLSGESVTTSGGFSITRNDSKSAFGINDARTGVRGGDFYDGGLHFAVGNNLFVNPGGTVDLTNNMVTTNTMVDIIPGVNAQIQYAFDPVRPVVRGLFSMTNTTGAPISTSALVIGNYGSDRSTIVQATSDGDLIVEDTDLWVVSNQSNNVGDEGSDPTGTISSHGAGAAVVPRTVITLGQPAGGASGEIDNYGYRYDLTIPAGATVRLLLFNEMNDLNASAVAGAADFESLTAASAAGLLTGLTSTQLSEIVNYVAAPANTTPNDIDDGLFGIGGGGIGLLSMAGVMLWLRRRREPDAVE